MPSRYSTAASVRRRFGSKSHQDKLTQRGDDQSSASDMHSLRACFESVIGEGTGSLDS